MFPYPIATPQKCDIQTFYGTNDSGGYQTFTWNKPVGVSHVYMLLIGAGGTGDGAGNGGGSGAVTVWYGAAQHVPNNLLVTPSTTSGNSSSVSIRTNTEYNLLSADPAAFSTAGAATTAGKFAASGFYKSTAGENGSNGTVSASSATFLSGGTIAGTVVSSNYGYKNAGSSAATAANGYFQLQPIIVGVGGSGAFKGGVGCGSGSNATYPGGPGMVLIASW
jgi:hypothetical protein